MNLNINLPSLKQAPKKFGSEKSCYFQSKTCKKQIYEINKEVEKALESFRLKIQYGDSAKYVIFTAADKKGNDTDGKK